MKSIDAEIFEVEQRLHRREASLKSGTRELKSRSVKALMSPVTIAGAVALGFLVAGGVGRRKAKDKRTPEERREARDEKQGFAVGSLAMAAATWLIRSQFGGPVGLAHYVLSKFQGNKGPSQSIPHRGRAPH